MVVPVEDLLGAVDEVVSVCGGNLLDHDRGGLDGGDGVTAGATIADAVAVDFVDNVLAAVLVLEAGGVDDAAVAGGKYGVSAFELPMAVREEVDLLEVASEALITCCVGPSGIVRGSGADAVDGRVLLRLSGIVHHICSTSLEVQVSACGPRRKPRQEHLPDELHEAPRLPVQYSIRPHAGEHRSFPLSNSTSRPKQLSGHGVHGSRSRKHSISHPLRYRTDRESSCR